MPSHPPSLQAFVQFNEPSAATRARAAINGRLFAGSTVQVAFIEEAEFEAVAALQ